MCFPRTFPPALVAEFAQKLDDGGADQLWVIEDCFFTGGVSLASAALSITERLRVGLGILPAVARNPAITAMEIATLAGLGPGRLIAGIGHGVQSWMAQMGVRPESPLTALDEVMTAVRRLLAGDTVTATGDYVWLDAVALDQPPAEPPPLLAGVMGPKSLTLAGRIADGVVLAEPASPSYVRRALDRAGRPDGFHVATFTIPCILDDRIQAYRTMAPWLSDLLAQPRAALTALPFFTEMSELHARKGVDGLVGMPPDWWSELGAIGTMDDALAHIDALEAAGAHSIGMFPAADIDIARAQLDQVLALATR